MRTLKNIFLAVVFAAVGLSACTDVDLDTVVDHKNNFKTVSDANSAILGLYGMFLNLAEQTVVLNELRADLMDVTLGATTDLQEINSHTPSANNKYADQAPYYRLIQNCNDLADGFKRMYAENRISGDLYGELYSDVCTVRSWAYLQLAIHFGRVAYTTDPTVTVTDAEKLAAAGTIGIDELLPLLIDCMVNLPTLEDYQTIDLVKDQLDGYDLKRFFINKRLLLGDLYLWNNDYLQAATQYRAFLYTDEDRGATNNNTRYRAGKYTVTSLSAASESYFQITYVRYKDYDLNSYVDTWTNMFSFPADKSALWYEMIQAMSYDSAFEPVYPFIELFANEGEGKYLLKPSQYAMDKLWGAQVQQNGFGFDGRGNNSSYAIVNGEPVVQKYLYDYDATRPYEKNGRWFLNRTAVVLLRYAEAANRSGYPLLAYSILNEGFKNTYNWDEYGELGRQTGYGPGNYYPEPFYFDARQMDAPTHRAPWRDFSGIRGRVSLKPVEFPGNSSPKDSILFMEQALIREAALEYGFEGHRWGDLLRVARRLNREGYDGAKFLKDAIAPKFETSPTPMPDLSSEDKWYLK